jgi:signal transduction histidine kinase
MMHILLFLILSISPATQTDRLFVASDSLFDKDGIITLGNQEGWRFQAGDDLNRANPDFDDSEWIYYKPSGLTEPIPDSLWNGYGWFRLRFAADSSVYAKVTHLYFSTWGAAEVYLDGNMVRKYGVFSLDKKSEKLSNPINKTHPAIVFQPSESHVLAVRFSYHKGQCFKKLFGKHARTFGFDTGLTTENLNQNIIASNYPKKPLVYILGTMMFLIVLLHISMYLLFPEEQSNLYISIVTFLLLLQIIATYLSHFFQVNVLQYLIFSRIPFIVLFMAALSMFPLTINYMFKQRHRLIHKILIWLFPVFALANFILAGFGNPNIVVSVIFSTVIIFFTSRVLIQSWRTKQKGVWIVAIAFLGVVIVAISWVFYIKLSKNFSIEIHSVMMYLIYGSIPFGLTAFTANRFRDLYKNLEQKVKERTWELNQSLENLRSTQTQLIQTEKMASLGQLTAGIAHEIQNPLNFVNNFSEVSNELIDEMKDELAAGNWQLKLLTM